MHKASMGDTAGGVGIKSWELAKDERSQSRMLLSSKCSNVLLFDPPKTFVVDLKI